MMTRAHCIGQSDETRDGMLTREPGPGLKLDQGLHECAPERGGKSLGERDQMVQPTKPTVFFPLFAL